LELEDVRDYPAAVARVRRMLDLDADPQSVAAALAADPWIRPLVDARPGLRLVGAVDGAELAVRAVLGQQVSVASARAVAGRLASRLGEPLADPKGPLRCAFPTAERLAGADPHDFPLPRARAVTLLSLAAAIRNDAVQLDAGADREETCAALHQIKGVGPWTVGYIRMRALGDPDVYLEGDVGVRRAQASLRCLSAPAPVPSTGGAPDPQRWRPWSSYAVAHLWASLGQEPVQSARLVDAPEAL
jgi:AraC family transcriptional regulator of adaptative response / DNA-3-methyladenine glycosylase II